MKYKKGDLVSYNGDIFLITGFGPYESPFTNNYSIYTFINLTTNVQSLKQSSYSEEYLDKLAEKIG